MGIFSRKPKQDTPLPDTDAAHQAAAKVAPPSQNPDQQLVDNTLVQDALTVWVGNKSAQTMFEVVRQCATGSLLLDITNSTFADPTKGFQPGDSIAISHQIDNAGKKVLLAFTSQDRLNVYRSVSIGSDAQPISLSQPATAVIKQAIKDYEGIVIDASSLESCLAYDHEIFQALTEDPAVNEALKTAIVTRRPTAEILAAAEAAPVVWIGTREQLNEAGEVTHVYVPPANRADGSTLSAAFTSPAEVWAWGPDLKVRPTGFANVARAALLDGHTGVVLNLLGPSATIPAEDLRKFS
ncbi:MAG: SseB family protein [Glaciihabitans sp.]|nr:SseB family protein [Glaciihabitans sp.]